MRPKEAVRAAAQSDIRQRKTNDEAPVGKDTGHGIENITRALEHLQKRTPAEVRQLAKSGRAKQARKTYKLTTAGIRHGQRMMGGTGEEVDDGGEEA